VGERGREKKEKGDAGSTRTMGRKGGRFSSRGRKLFREEVKNDTSKNDWRGRPFERGGSMKANARGKRGKKAFYRTRGEKG